MSRIAWTLVLCLWTASALAQPQQNRGGGGPDQGNARSGQSGQRGPGGPGGPGGGMGNPMFNAIDADGDGVITTRELRKAVAALKKLDTDGDGNITLAEVGGPGGPGGPGGDPAQMIDRLMQGDKNGDGKLTADEVPPQMMPMLQGADTNGDGALDRDELKAHMEEMQSRFQAGGGPGRFGGRGNNPQQMTRRIMQNDLNHDGKLTADEVPQNMMPLLQGADQNNDGAIDARELQMAVRQLGERAGRGGQFGPGGGQQQGGQNRGQGIQ